MKNKSILVMLAISFACTSQAQLSYWGYQTDRITVDATVVGNQPWNVIQGFSAPDALFYTESIQSIRANQVPSVTGQDYASVYYSFAVGNVPVRVNSLDCTFTGKFVYGGGGANDTAIAALQGSLGLFEYNDDNNNNVYDFGESIFGALGSGIVELARLEDNGLQEYSQTVSVTSPGYILAANTKYAMFQRYGIQIVGNLNPNSTSTVITNEYHYPSYAGTIVHLNHEAVPEPATLAVIALGLPFLRKRRK